MNDVINIHEDLPVGIAYDILKIQSTARDYFELENVLVKIKNNSTEASDSDIHSMIYLGSNISVLDKVYTVEEIEYVGYFSGEKDAPYYKIKANKKEVVKQYVRK